MWYEPFSAETRDDPYRYYAELRESAPVYWAEGAQAWCVSRHEDVHAVLRTPEVFSSDAMRSMLIGASAGVDPLNDPAAVERVLAMARAFPFSLDELAVSRNLIAEDPPRHGVMRQIVNRGFTPRRIASWEPRVREIVGECIGRLRDGESFDLVGELAIPVPVRIIAEMIGVEPERFEEFKHWSDAMIAGLTGSLRDTHPDESGLAKAMGDLLRYIQGVVEERRRRPGDDLVSVLIAAQEGEAGLTEMEVCFFIVLLLVAGNETTTNLIGNASLALLRHRDQLERVAAEPQRVPAVLEETLRWDGPVQFVMRTTRGESELSGGRVPANAHVVVLLGSANRDERHWGATAARFDIERPQQGHLAFGFGNHFCLGAALSRLEAKVAMEALLPELRRSDWRGGRIEHVDSFLVRGPRELVLSR